MEENRNGATTPHGEETPTNNFNGKVTKNSGDLQLGSTEKVAYRKLVEMVCNPTEPKRDSIFVAKSANEWLMTASKKGPTQCLWDAGWDEGETCILFSDSNMGKSLLGVQVGVDIAATQKVLYIDFELSDRQFLTRYQDEFGSIFQFPDTFIRAEMDFSSLDEDDDLDNIDNVIVGEIEQLMIDCQSKVLILDNLSAILNEAEKGSEAGKFMKRFNKLKKKHGWSMLILSHTPKRSLYNPITQNDLAGSKRLINFVDSAVAIGQSALDENLKFVKTVKYRNGGFKYPSDSVLLGEIVKSDGFTGFKWKGTVTEKSQLRQPGEEEDKKLKEKALQLQGEGKSQREIASLLNLSLSKVNRLLKS